MRGSKSKTSASGGKASAKVAALRHVSQWVPADSTTIDANDANSADPNTGGGAV